MLIINFPQIRSFTQLYAMAFFLPCSMALDANLLTNGDFEKSSSENMMGWKVVGQNKAPSFTTDAGFMHGKSSFHFLVENKQKVSLYTTNLPNAEGGKAYTTTFFAKSPVVGQSIRVFYWQTDEKGKAYSKAKQFSLTPEWNKYEFTQKLDRLNLQKVSVRFDVASGEAFLDEVSVEQTNKTATISPFIAPARKNLLNNPGFELGWLGWYVKYGGTEKDSTVVQTYADEKVKFEGSASLKIEPDVAIMSQRYPIEPDQKYTFSFYARAEPASGSNRSVNFTFLNAGGEKPKQKMLTLTVGKDIGPEWKRYSITYSFPEEVNATRNTAYLRIDSRENHLWVDAIQFEKGDTATPYECGLQAAIVSDSKTGLFVQGKAQDVNVVLTGTGGVPEGVVIDMTARDVFSNTLFSAKLPVTPTKNEVFSIPFTLKNEKLGVAEVSVEVKKGDEILSRNRCRYCVIDAPPENTKVNPYFGTWVYRSGPIWWEGYNNNMSKYAGSGFGTLYVNWANEKGMDPSQLESLKQKLAPIKAAGKINVGVLQNGVSGKIKFDSRAKWDVLPTEEEVTAACSNYNHYCELTSAALGELVDYYNLLGEINIMRVHGTKLDGTYTMPPERAVRFIKAGSQGIHKGHPHAKATLGINGLTAFDYIEALFKLGVANDLDAMGVDAYQATPELPPVYENVQKLRSIVNKYSKGMPLMNVEQYFGVRDLGIYSSEDDHDYFCDSEEDHAGRILQTGLHYVASDASFSLFRTELTLFTQGISGPTHFYFSYGGYRFASQTLHDITHSSSPMLNPAIRAFYFERKDGTKIVTLNTKTFGRKGGARNTGATKAFDYNGNSLDVSDIPVNYVPVYLMYEGTESEILAKIKAADFYGIDSPFQTTFAIENNSLMLNIQNSSNKPVNGTLTFNQFPAEWKSPSPVEIKALAPKASLPVALPVTTPIKWENDYNIVYTIATEESMVQRNTRLASIFAPKNQSIIVDGRLDEWSPASFINIGEKHILPGKGNPYQGPNDLSASMAMSWDNDNIYVAINVTDDQVVTSERVRLHENDSVQLYFDMQNDATDIYDANDSAYCLHVKDGIPTAELEKAPTGYFVGANNAMSGPDRNVKVAYTETSRGYIYEAAFPRSTLSLIDHKEGAEFGFSLTVNDNDGNGKLQSLTLGSVPPYNKPKTWKTIRLTKP